MAEAVALEFEAPTGESLRFEWHSDELAALDPAASNGDPVWRLGGELDWDQIEAVRVLSGRLDDGRLIAIAALRPAEAEGHGDELIAGVIGDAEGFEQLHETLLSTEYGDDGKVRRIGLELYPSEDAMPIRVAGEATGAASSNEGGIERSSAALALRSAGASGAGILDQLRRE
jgi:hypothetical protein